MKKYLATALFALACVSLVSCRKKDQEPVHQYRFQFNAGTHGWKAFFSDYPVGEETFFELEFAHQNLPAPLDPSVKALKISGNNHSDDLLSMITRKFEGLKPNTTYAVTFNVELASNVATNSIGIGGTPDLALGAGGLSYEPKSTVDEQDWYRPNFSSALQSRLSNDTLKMLGRIGVNDTTTDYTLINRNNGKDPVYITSNANGELWLLIGTDSGFEGPTTLYFKSIDIRFR